MGNYWGITYYQGKEYCTGTGCLDITDPNNPQIHNGCDLPKDGLFLDTVVPAGRQLPVLVI